jgi:tRNA U34 5-methylaminomethyl-2-thiouridine-forming methyltransferase MnmC
VPVSSAGTRPTSRFRIELQLFRGLESPCGLIGLVRPRDACDAHRVAAPQPSYSIVTVANGARSLRSLEHGETFHPVVGPMAEARGLHVAQSRLAERARESRGPFVIWDVGLGAAANAVAALDALQDVSATIELHSFDLSLEPLDFALRHAAELAYIEQWKDLIVRLLADGSVQAGPVRWVFHPGDFREIIAEPPAPSPHAILYDPYSPAANPGMWTLEHFTRLRRTLDDGRPCTLTSYSRSTAVRVSLALAGFFVGRGAATGEKTETTIAATRRDLLAVPLGEDWLARVARSTRGGPLRGAASGPITAEEMTQLRAMLAAGR